MVRTLLRRLATPLVAIALVAGLLYAANGPQPSVGLYWLQNSDPTLAAGVAAPLNQLLIRTDLPSLYYKSGAANTAWTKIGSVSSGGTVTSIGCGTGLSCAASNPITTAGTLTLAITPTTCGAGTAEITTAADGTSTCAAFGSGSVTSVTCGTGLACTATNPFTAAGTVTLAITPTTCGAGTAEVSTAADGTSTCAAFGSSTLSGLTTNTIPKATSASTIGNSGITDDGTTVATTELLSIANTSSVGETITAYATRPGIVFQRANGTSGAPTAVAVDEEIMGIQTSDYTSAAAFSTPTGLITAQAAEAFTNAAQGAFLRFWTVPTGSTTRASRMKIDYDGNVGIGDYDTSAGGKVPYKLTVGTATVPGIAAIKGGVIMSGVVTPTAISGTVNNYDPTDSGTGLGLSTARVLRVSTASSATITGIAAQPAGTMLMVCAATATSGITLNMESGSSTAANRILGPDTYTVVLASDESCASLWYDAAAKSATGRWIVTGYYSLVDGITQQFLRDGTHAGDDTFSRSVTINGVSATAALSVTNGATIKKTTTKISADSGTAPGLSAGCGTGATASTGNSHFTLTVQATGLGTCVATFGVALSSATPTCIVTSRNAVPVVYTANATTITLTTGLVAAQLYDVDCWDH